jgi:hypothetical protein
MTAALIECRSMSDVSYSGRPWHIQSRVAFGYPAFNNTIRSATEPSVESLSGSRRGDKWCSRRETGR